jgi:hypothetical protein
MILAPSKFHDCPMGRKHAPSGAGADKKEEERMISQPGVYELTHEEYHRDPAPEPSLSRSTIKDLISRTPAHAFWNNPRLNPAYQPDDGAGKFDVGLASHSLLLEGIDNVEVIDFKDWKKDTAKEARESAREEGKVPLLTHQFEAVKKCVVRVEEQIYGCKELGIKSLSEKNPVYQGYGKSEQSFFWEEAGTWFRTRTDWISNDCKLIIDCKFTEMSVNPADIARYIISMGLDIQSSLYSRGSEKVTGIKPKFVFIMAEVAPPYICSFISLPPEFMVLGNSKVEYGIYLWRECMKKNEWPAYANRVHYPDLPGWAMAAWDNKALEIGEGK